MSSLRIFLFLRHASNEWKVSSHRELDPVLSEWNASDKTQVVGVLHIGFDRPSTDELEPIVNTHIGKIFLTASAKFALPEKFKCSEKAIGYVGLIPLHIGLHGWGYKIDESEIKDLFNIDCVDSINKPSSLKWFEEIACLKTEIVKVCHQHNIFDEAGYIKNEHNLPLEIRGELGRKYFQSKTGFLPSSENIIDVLKFSPPWLLELPVGALYLSTRPSNVFRSKDIKIIRDLTAYSAVDMSRWDSFGRRSMTEITEKLIDIFYSGPLDLRFNLSKPASSDTSNISSIASENFFTEKHNFLNLLQLTLDSLQPTQSEIIELRMGLHGRPHTLQEVGNIKGVSRERIRQIESKAIRLIRGQTIWTKDVPHRLNTILSTRETPLPFDGIEIVDEWFAGLSGQQTVFEYVIEHFFSANIYLINSGEITYLSDISQQTWIERCREGKKLVENSVKDNISINDLRLLLDGLMCDCHESLRDAYWNEVTKNAHFVNEKLVSVGFGLDHTIRAILEESTTPIHYKDFPKLLELRGNAYIPSAIRCQAACGNVAFLVGRGLYGLEHHTGLSPDEIEIIILEIESLISDGEPNRQWHSRELCDHLIEQNIIEAERINPYLVNYALNKSTALVFLGRMIWASTGSGATTSASRLDIRQAIESVVRHAGRPLTTAEVRKTLSRERGLNSTFQIFPEGEIIRIKPGVWGLMSRDVPLNADECLKFVELLEAFLQLNQRGVHVTEIVDAVKDQFPRALTLDEPYLLFGIAQKYPVFTLASGGYVYLTIWNEPRRFNISEAVMKVLKDAGNSGISLKLANELVEILIERSLPPNTTFASVALGCGGVYDSKKMLWFHEEYLLDEELQSN